jgi:hypothetical protein
VQQLRQIRLVTHIDTAGEEAAEEEAAIQDAVGNVTELYVLETTSAEIANGAKHANGAKRDEADDDDLRPWRVVWRAIVSVLFTTTLADRLTAKAPYLDS